MDESKFSVDISEKIEINASLDESYRAFIRRISTENATPDNTPMPMVLEEWPGGRWFRDLGDQQGHLWGFVQVIKPPTLLEIHGPMFMSYAVASHVQFRFTEIDGGTEMSLRHRVLGFMEDAHREGITLGWGALLEGTKQIAE